MKHVLDKKLCKARSTGSAPYYDPTSKDMGAIYSGQQGMSNKDSFIGPRGGRIKSVSLQTGKPIYYKSWESGQGYGTHDVIDPGAGESPSGDYQTYDKGGVIGKTSSGLPIHAQSNINNTKNYLYSDHKDAHHAHFTMAQYIRGLIQKRQGSDTTKLNGLYDAHMGFARHHKEQALLDMLHGKGTPASQEDLGKREEKSGKTIAPMRNIPGSRVKRVTR